MEPIVIAVAPASYSFDGTIGADVIDVSVVNGRVFISGTSGGDAFETVELASPTESLEIRGLGGSDTITVHVTDTYRPKFLSFIGIGDLSVSSQASARLIRSLGGNER